jgi:hypothetical protein
VKTVKFCPQRELTAGNLGSEDIENARILWPVNVGTLENYMKPKVESLEIHVTTSWSWQNVEREGSAGTVIEAQDDGWTGCDLPILGG